MDSFEPEVPITQEPRRALFRSQIRFRMAPASHDLAEQLRKGNAFQVIWGRTATGSLALDFEDTGLCWPGPDEGLLILEIIHGGPATAFNELKLAHESFVAAHLKGLSESHGFAERVALNKLEPRPASELL